MDTGNLPIIRCKCGAEFLLIPDLDEMSRTVERHAQSHKEKEHDPLKADVTFAEIQDYLIMQVFQKVRRTS